MDYVRGLQVLKRYIPEESLDEFSVHEANLLENLHSEGLYGSTETTRAERMRIVDRPPLWLARRCCDISFTEMCHNPSVQATRINLPVTFPETSTASPRVTEAAAQNRGAEEQPPSRSTTVKMTPPWVTVKLLTTTVPTAYYRQLDVGRFPLVTVHIDNTSPACDDATLSMRAFIEGYSDAAVRSIDVAKSEQTSVSLLPILKPEAVERLNDIQWATLHVIIKQVAPVKRQLSGSDTWRIALHARNTALLEEEGLEGEVVDLTNYLAAWVTPRHRSIDPLLRRAHAYNEAGAFDGYGGNVGEQAGAIFTALKQDTQLVYTDSYRNIGTKPHQFMQRVRLPSESLEVRMANCLDGAVLFASLLESIAIEPLLLLIPGHAVVGWRVCSGGNEYEFLDTTLISQTDFMGARQAGDAVFNTYKDYQNRTLFDPDGFARVIDIVECREQGIYPLQ